MCRPSTNFAIDVSLNSESRSTNTGTEARTLTDDFSRKRQGSHVAAPLPTRPRASVEVCVRPSLEFPQARRGNHPRNRSALQRNLIERKLDKDVTSHVHVTSKFKSCIRVWRLSVVLPIRRDLMRSNGAIDYN